MPLQNESRNSNAPKTSTQKSKSSIVITKIKKPEQSYSSTKMLSGESTCAFSLKQNEVSVEDIKKNIYSQKGQYLKSIYNFMDQDDENVEFV